MGWSLGYDSEHDRWRGYGVPAYCDAHAAGCTAEIDRGLAYMCDDLAHEHEDGFTIFVCGDHTCADVDVANLPPEHPRWAAHLLNADSWAKWRDENPEKVASLREAAERA